VAIIFNFRPNISTPCTALADKITTKFQVRLITVTTIEEKLN